MSGFHKIKIYRDKLRGYILFLGLVSIFLCGLTCVFFIYQWLSNAQEEADNAIARTEAGLNMTVGRLDYYMQRLYANQNRELFNDLLRFLGNNAGSYLHGRLESSVQNTPIASFPEDVMSYFRGGFVTQVSVHNMKSANVITLQKDTGVSFEFNVSNADPRFEDYIGSGFLYKKKIAALSGSEEWLGECYFLIDSDHVFEDLTKSGVRNIYVADESEQVYGLTGGRESGSAHAKRILQDNRVNNAMYDEWFAGYRYKVYPSSQFQFKYINIIYTMDVVRDHLAYLLFIVAVFFAIFISVLTIIVLNLRYDAVFLTGIINKINKVKNGDFEPGAQPTKKLRKNEYGMIAQELNDMGEQLDKYIKTEYLLKIKQKEMEMKLLQNQINPHFLYNTLEVIRSAALVGGNENVADAISALGGMYREIVGSEDIIDVGMELRILERYLKIMEYKYPDSFFYKIDVSEPVRRLKTVKFWMQPLAENFIIHGFEGTALNLFIVNGYEGDGAWIIDMIDNGKSVGKDKLEALNSLGTDDDKPDKPAGYGIGLKNVHSRLHYLYGDAFSMKISNNDEGGIRVRISIEKNGGNFIV